MCAVEAARAVAGVARTNPTNCPDYPDGAAWSQASKGRGLWRDCKGQSPLHLRTFNGRRGARICDSLAPEFSR